MKTNPENKPATWQSVADSLGVSRQAVANWRKLPGSPAEPDAAAWRAYVDGNDLGKRDAGKLVALKAELLRQQIEKAKRENARAGGELISIEEVGASMSRVVHAFASAMRFEFEQSLPPRLMGKDIAGIRKEIRDSVDSMIRDYNKAIERGKQEAIQRDGE